MSDEEQLRELFMEQFHIDESLCTNETKIEDLGADSLELLEFVVAVEEMFDIELDEEQIENCSTLGEAFDLIMERVREDV